MNYSVDKIVELAIVSLFLDKDKNRSWIEIDEDDFEEHKCYLGYKRLEETLFLYEHKSKGWLRDNDLTEEEMNVMIKAKGEELGAEGVNRLCRSYWDNGFRQCYGKNCYLISNTLEYTCGYGRFWEDTPLVNEFWCNDCSKYNCFDKDGNRLVNNKPVVAKKAVPKKKKPVIIIDYDSEEEDY